jgi:hypothetical protein
MHKISTHVENVHRVVAMLVAMAVLAWSVGAFERVQAANLIQISNTLSDSSPSSVSNHTIEFTVPSASTGMGDGDTITVTFPASFNMGLVAIGDVDLLINSASQTLAGAPNGTTWGFDITGSVLTFTASTTPALEADDEVVILVGTNADGGVNQVSNPPGPAASYEFVVTAGADAGRMRVAILPTVEVTAIVETTFAFTVSGVAAGEVINGATTTGTSSTTSIPFGVLEHDTFYSLGQELTVSTNAANGFVVTVEKDGPFQSSTGAIIDTFIDSSYENTPTAWQAPGRDIFASTTWGHWGLTSDDETLNGNEFNASSTDQTAGNRWVAASTTPRAVFAHSGPADGETQNIGLARVAYAVEITPFQEAGFDYKTTLMYIATPTF